MVRMIRRAQIDSSDGARVRAWIGDYTGCMRRHAAEGIEIRAWQQAYGEYGLAYWTFDAPDLAALDAFLVGLGAHEDLAEILLQGSPLFVSGMTKDTLLRELT